MWKKTVGHFPWYNLVKIQECFQKHSSRKAEGVTSGETSGEIMLGSTQGALREMRFNLLGLECISQM